MTAMLIIHLDHFIR